MTFSEKAAYLRGLAEGVSLSSEGDAGKVLRATVDLLAEMASAVDSLAETQSELGDEIDDLIADVASLEDRCGDDEDDEEEDDGDGCSCGGHHHHHHHEHDDVELYQVDCPKCGETLYLDAEGISVGYIDCPACGERLDFDLSALEEDEECGDDCSCHKE